MTVTGRLDQVSWRAWDDSDWAASGRAFLLPVVSGWKATRPCCDVSVGEVATRWRVVLPDGTQIADEHPATSASSTPEPRFVIPETATRGTLRLDVIVTFTMDGAQRTARATPVLIPFAEPQ